MQHQAVRGLLAPACFGHSSEACAGSRKKEAQNREEEVETESWGDGGVGGEGK